MTDIESAQSLASRLGRLLAERGEHLAVAEGATGGALANLLTNIPGSSSWFRAGIVAYTDYPKQLLLRVSRDTLIDQGAISAEATVQMARLSRRLFGTQWAVAITGYADDTETTPDAGAQGVPGARTPGSEAIPDEKRTARAGLTFLAVAGLAAEDADTYTWEERMLPAPDRAAYKEDAAAAALEMLISVIQG
jgi:PncC family amidohydrolase